MPRYSLFGRSFRDASVQLIKVLHYLHEQEDIHLEVKARKVV